MTPITKVVQQLRSTSGSNAKKQLLQRNDSKLLREVLQATYDPFTKYGIKKIPPYGKGSLGTLEGSWPQIRLVLGQLAQGHGSDSLKSLLSGTLRAMTKEDADIICCIVKKDLEAGISAKTINAVFPGLIEEFGIMKAATFEDSLWQPDLMGSVKLDGYRCLVRDGVLLSSGGHRILGAEHIEERIQGLGNFDGEIKVPEMNFQEGGGAIRSANVTPDAKLFVFDYIDNMRAPFKNRYAALAALAQDQGWATSLTNPTTITLLRHRAFASLQEMKQIYDKALYAGHEGLVLKDPYGYYELKRSKAWLKVKQVLSETCKIIGFFEGEGKYVDMLGGVYVKRQNGYESKVGGGFSDHLRSYMWNHQAAFLGVTIEVHYQEDTPAGDFRQARFKKFRPDKD